MRRKKGARGRRGTRRGKGMRTKRGKSMAGANEKPSARGHRPTGCPRRGRSPAPRRPSQRGGWSNRDHAGHRPRPPRQSPGSDAARLVLEPRPAGKRASPPFPKRQRRALYQPVYAGMAMRRVAQLARELGAELRPRRGTGELVFSHPDHPKRPSVSVHGQSGSAPRHLTVWLKQLQGTLRRRYDR